MMSLQDVLSRITFLNTSPSVSFSQSEQNTILAAITNLYSGSSIAAMVLENIVADSNVLTFSNNAGDSSFASFSNHEIAIDLQQITTTAVIDTTGVIHALSLERLIAHEMMHAIADSTDPNLTNFTTQGVDYIGDTVKSENGIMKQMGDDFSRASYYSLIEVSDLPQIGATMGANIANGGASIVIVDNQGFHNIDIQSETDAAVLVGLEGNDTIHAGSGDDALYGGIGNDILIGNDSWDYLSGGDGDDILIGGAGDPNDLNLSTAHPEWNDNKMDYLSGGAGLDQFYIYGSEIFYNSMNTSTALNRTAQVDRIDASDASFIAHFQAVFHDLGDPFLVDFSISRSMANSALSNGGTYLFGTVTTSELEVRVKGMTDVANRYVVWAETDDSKSILAVLDAGNSSQQQLVAPESGWLFS